MAKAKQYTVTINADAAAGLAKFEEIRAAFNPAKMTGMSTGDEVRLHFAAKPEAADLQAIRALFPGVMVTLDSEEVEDDPAVHLKGLIAGTLKGFRDQVMGYVLHEGTRPAPGMYRAEDGTVLLLAENAVLLNDPAPLLAQLATSYDDLDDELKATIDQTVADLLSLIEQIQKPKGKGKGNDAV